MTTTAGGEQARALRTGPSVVLLDVGETLLRPDPSWRDVYAGVFTRRGIRASLDEFERAFREAWVAWEHEGPFEATEEASFRRLMELDRLIFDRLGYPDLPESFFRDIEAVFHQRSAWYVFPDVVPALDVMQAAGLRLAVVSNWGWAAPELLNLLDLARHFEVLAISARVGYQKPHPAIFEHALDLLGVGPDQALHVGDDPEADLVGARRAGIEALLIVRGHRPPSRAQVEAEAAGVPLIRDLGELLDRLRLVRPTPLGAGGHGGRA